MKKLGMILLALFLIIDALLGFGVNIGPLVFLLYLSVSQPACLS